MSTNVYKITLPNEIGSKEDAYFVDKQSREVKKETILINPSETDVSKLANILFIKKADGTFLGGTLSPNYGATGGAEQRYIYLYPANLVYTETGKIKDTPIATSGVVAYVAEYNSTVGTGSYQWYGLGGGAGGGGGSTPTETEEAGAHTHTVTKTTDSAVKTLKTTTTTVPTLGTTTVTIPAHTHTHTMSAVGTTTATPTLTVNTKTATPSIKSTTYADFTPTISIGSASTPTTTTIVKTATYDSSEEKLTLGLGTIDPDAISNVKVASQTFNDINVVDTVTSSAITIPSLTASDYTIADWTKASENVTINNDGAQTVIATVDKDETATVVTDVTVDTVSDHKHSIS